jgi:hypothetical protein
MVKYISLGPTIVGTSFSKNKRDNCG